MRITDFRDRKVNRSRALRQNQTEPERRLWNALRNSQLDGLIFRRQYGRGDYIVDFVCLSAKLVVEIDGDSHGSDRAQTYDRRRTAWLEDQGYRVIRFWNTDVMQNLEGVLGEIRARLDEPSPGEDALCAPRHPLPQAGEG